MAIFFSGWSGGVSATTSGNALNLTGSSTRAVGDYLVVVGTCDPFNSSNPTITISGITGVTWSYSYARTGTTSGGIVSFFAYGRCTTSGFIPPPTINFSNSIVARAATWGYITGASNKTHPVATSIQPIASTSFSVLTAATVPAGALVIGTVAYENSTPVTAGDSDSTGGSSWTGFTNVTANTGVSTTSVMGHVQHKITTSAAGQTYNSTLSQSRQSGSQIIWFSEKKQRTATGSGLGTQTATRKITRKRTATGSGVGTQTATSVVIPRPPVQRTATGSGLGTQTSSRKITRKRTATGSGLGTQTAPRKITRKRTATGTGLGTSSATRLRRVQRVAATRVNFITNPSFETDLSTLVATGGATLARITTDSFVGSASLQITSTITDYNGVQINPRITVSASQTYTLSAYCRNVSGSTRTVYIGIQWYTSAGAFISESNSAGSGTLATASGWVRRSVTAVAPATAATARIFMLSGTTGLSAGWLTNFDGVLFENSSTILPYIDTIDGVYSTQSATRLITRKRTSSGSGLGTSTATRLRKVTRTAFTRTNLVINPSFETNTTGWASIGTGTTTITRTTSQSLFGSASLQGTATVAGNMRLANATSYTAPPAIPVTVGQVYTASAYSRAATTPRLFDVLIEFFNSAGTTISVPESADITNSTTGWTRQSVTATAPATAVTARMSIRMFSVVIGEVHYIDGALFENLATLNAYIDTSEAYGSSTATRLVRNTRSASGVGSGTSTALKQIPPVGINWSYWGTNALLNSP